MRRPPRWTFRRPGRSLDDERAEMEEEIAFHLDRHAEELEAAGWPPEEARREAERRFGDISTTRETCARESRRATTGGRRRMGIDALRQDIAYAVRALRRAPTWTAVVVTTLAIGIALNTLVFSVMSPYLLRPLPYAEPDELVHLGGASRADGWDLGRFSLPQLGDLRERSRSFAGLEGYFYGTTNLVGDGVAERLTTSWTTGGLFGLLGVEAAVGRMPGPADALPEAAPVVLLGHGLWTRRFGADPAIVGRTIRLNGEARTVIGVAPPVFNFPFNAVELWLPLPENPDADRAAMNTLVIGRLADGSSASEAEAELQRILAELAAMHPREDGSYDTIVLHSLREALNFAWDILRPAFHLLLAGVSFVLVIACVNVASLTLARASTRGREVAVRAAVGAGRARLVRQLLVESAVLAVAGGALGIALAHAGTRLLGGLIPPDIYRVGEIALDGRVLAFSALVTLVTPFLFGLAPALTSVRRDLTRALKDEGPGGGSRAVVRGRRLLVLAEVALAVVLVTGTGLMVRSLANALSTDLGFPAERLLTVALTPDAGVYEDAAELDQAYRRIAASLARVPGVEAVGAVSHLPLNHETFGVRFAGPESAEVPVDQRPTAYTSRAAPGYFAAMDIALVSGRDFRDGPGDFEEGSVIVSRGLVERLWPGESGVGRLLVWGGDEPITSTIVGVVEDVRYDDLAGTPRPHVYRALEGAGTRRRFLVLRTTGEAGPPALVDPVRRALRSGAPDLPAELRPMMEIVRESTGLWAIGSGFLAVFGAVALGLAGLGIYGVVSFTVQQRRRELGLRMALGADRRAIGRAVLGEGIRLTSLGLVVGVALATGGASLASGLFFGVGPLDPTVLAAAVGVFAVVSVTASLLPARRAVRLDPVEVLRSE